MKKKTAKKTKKSEHVLKHYTICFTCAVNLGGKAQGCNTVYMDTCPYCHQVVGVSTITDYVWPKKMGVRYVFD